MDCLPLTFHFGHCSLFLVRLLVMIEFATQYCVNNVPHVSLKTVSAFRALLQRDVPR